jgi:hypothetical protein
VTAAVAAALLLLALVDGACAGFRASAGRTGLIRHRQADRRAARRGAALVAALMTPAVTLTCAGYVLHHPPGGLYLRAGEAMLAVYGPYALVVLAALGCYATLGWRKRYLATAVILGPLTLIRPVVVVLGAAVAVLATHDVGVAIAAALAGLAVLAVEPVAGHLWYAPRERSAPSPLFR